jgi:hypothetical protein
MKQGLVLTALAVLLLLHVAAGAEAQAVGKRCRDVQAGGKRATHVFADFMPCRSARAKLRRWLPRERLPRNRNGWFCYRFSGRVHACTYPGERPIADPKSFTFWLRRTARSAQRIRECGNAGTLYRGQVRIYNVTSRVVRCRFARRFARSQVRNGGPACREDRWCTFRGWRCRHVAYRTESDIRCTRFTAHAVLVVRWQYG